MDIKKLTAKKSVQLIKNKEISVSEFVSLFVERSKIINNKINSLITICEDEAMERAKYIDENFNDFKDKELVGVPISIKDAINTKDILTTAGSKILNNFIPPKNAFVVDKLLHEGAIITSKSNCDEFAMGSSNETSQYGPCLNPWNITKVPGGSSGGSAASVASSQNLLSIGSDTGGSIRQPASLCGVVGLKPTYGTVSRNGLIAFGSSLDQVGPFSKNVEDCELLYNTIKGYDKDDLTSLKNFTEIEKKGVNELKIGICDELTGEGISDDVKMHFENSIDGLTILQEYIEADPKVIHRLEFVNSKFLYTVQVDAGDSFELCPCDSKNKSLTDNFFVITKINLISIINFFPNHSSMIGRTVTMIFVNHIIKSPTKPVNKLRN